VATHLWRWFQVSAKSAARNWDQITS
jgi:hypothetical protein